MNSRLSIILLAVGFILILLAFESADIPIQFSPYKIVPEFPFVIWLALIFIVIGLLLILVNGQRKSDAFVLAAIVLVVSVFFGSLLISERNLRYYDSWYNSSYAKTIATSGYARLEDGSYNSWPSSFIWLAELNIITGVDFPLLARFLPVILNCFAFVWIFLLYRRLGLRNKAALVAIIVFILANDRVYINECPSNFIFAFYGTTMYMMLLGVYPKEKYAHARSSVIFLLLLITMISAHPLIPLFVLSPAIVFMMIALFFRQRKTFARVSKKFFAGAALWIFWSNFAIAPFWWENIIENIRNFSSRIVASQNLIGRPLSYWKYGNPPLTIQELSFFIIGVTLVLGFFGFIKYVRELNSRPRTWNIYMNSRLPFLFLISMSLGLILAGALPYVVLGGSMETDKVLLFMWIPISFFVGYLFMKSKRNLRKIYSIVLVVLLIPAFTVLYWNDFWLSTHTWQISGFSFLSNIPSSTIVTDTGSANIFRYFSPGSTFLTDGGPERPGLALLVFLGKASPISIKSEYGYEVGWDFFIRSKVQEVRLNLNFGVPNETLTRLDTELSNIPAVNRIYDNNYVQVYDRND